MEEPVPPNPPDATEPPGPAEEELAVLESVFMLHVMLVLRPLVDDPVIPFTVVLAFWRAFASAQLIEFFTSYASEKSLDSPGFRSVVHWTLLPTCVQPFVERAESNTAPEGSGPCSMTTFFSACLPRFTAVSVYWAIRFACVDAALPALEALEPKPEKIDVPERLLLDPEVPKMEDREEEEFPEPDPVPKIEDREEEERDDDTPPNPLVDVLNDDPPNDPPPLVEPPPEPPLPPVEPEPPSPVYPPS